MIDALFKRKICREFIKAYSEELWKQVIPDVFEIGVLSLEKSFNKILFSKEEFKEILDDLRSDEYFKRFETKKIEPIAKKINKVQKEEKKESSAVYPSWWGEDVDECKKEIEKQTRINKRKHKKHHHHHKRQITTSSSNEESVSDSYYDSHPMIMNRLTKTPTEKYNPMNKTNYKISYDKNLKPESIEKKEKEQKYSYSTGRNGLQRTPSVERMRPQKKEIQEDNMYQNQYEQNYYENQQYNNNIQYETAKSNQSEHSHHSNSNTFNNIQPSLAPVREESNDDNTVNTNPNESNRSNQQINYRQITYNNKIPSNNINVEVNENSSDYRNSQDINYGQPLYQMDNNDLGHKQYISSQPLQTSNLSNHNEQLSMIEVDEGMKNLFRNKLNCQYDNSGSSGNTYQVMN